MTPSIFHIAFLGHTHPMFDFGEGLFDGVEVRGVGRQEPEPCARCFDGGAHGLGFMTTEVVHDDDVAGLQSPDKLLFDISQEARPVDRSVEDTRCRELIVAKRGQEGHGAPMAVWCKADQALALRSPATQRRHIGLDPGLVDKDKALRLKPGLKALPPPTPARHRRPRPLKSEQGFF